MIVKILLALVVIMVVAVSGCTQPGPGDNQTAGDNGGPITGSLTQDLTGIQTLEGEDDPDFDFDTISQQIDEILNDPYF